MPADACCRPRDRRHDADDERVEGTDRQLLVADGAGPSTSSSDANGTGGNLTMQHFDCRPGQEGTYTVGLSSDGRTMTLTPVGCLLRTRDILAGDWTRWPCPNPDSVCGSEARAGSPPASFDGARRPDSSDAHPPPVLSGYSYVVPAGWSSIWNAPGQAE